MYLRNRPIERDEVVIECFKILTLPGDACPPDTWGDPTFSDVLAEPLVEELKQERRDWERQFKKDMIELNREIGGLLLWAAERVNNTPQPNNPRPWAYLECRHCGRRFCYI